MLCTKPEQSRGPENIGPERPLLGHSLLGPVLSLTRTTPENNGKIRPQPDRENAFVGASGGGNATPVEPSLTKTERHGSRSQRKWAALEQEGVHRGKVTIKLFVRIEMKPDVTLILPCAQRSIPQDCLKAISKVAGFD